MKTSLLPASSLLCFAMVGTLPQSAGASTINNCGSSLICYGISLSTPDGSMTDDRDIFPVSASQSGIDPGFLGSGSASGVAAFGRLGSKSQVTYTSPIRTFSGGIGSAAVATFDDVFLWGGAAGSLRFTLNLLGSALVSGADPGVNAAFVDATLSADDTCCFLPGGFGGLTAPGMTTVTVPVAANDGVNFELRLVTTVGASEFGSASADFRDTLSVPRIEFLDASGNFVRDVTLMDRLGNVLGAPAAGVPEPATFLLLAAGLIAVWAGRKATFQ
jgi:hypothetical protein